MKLYKERKTRLIEMAEVARLNDIKLRIWSNDHEPAHFHAIKEGEYNVIILIPEKMPDSLPVVEKGSKFGKGFPKKDQGIILDWIQTRKLDPELDAKVTGLGKLKSAWRIIHN